MVQLQYKRAGMAILSVVVVLSTLLLIGVLFAMTVELDMKANKFYREAGRTEMIAIEGVYRAIGEIMYDQWGTNEDRSFKLSNHGKDGDGKHIGLKTRADLILDNDEVAQNAPAGATGVEAAYYRTTRSLLMERDPDELDYDNKKANVRPKSKYRMTIETIKNPGNPLGTSTEFDVLTDYRWVVETGRPGLRGPRAESVSQDKDVFYFHSGAPYHDEFLPEQTDVNDSWELGLHG